MVLFVLEIIGKDVERFSLITTAWSAVIGLDVVSEGARGVVGCFVVRNMFMGYSIIVGVVRGIFWYTIVGIILPGSANEVDGNVSPNVLDGIIICVVIYAATIDIVRSIITCAVVNITVVGSPLNGSDIIGVIILAAKKNIVVGKGVSEHAVMGSLFVRSAVISWGTRGII